MSSAILQLETEFKERLESIPFFATLEVLTEPRKNLIAEINARVARLGTVIVPKATGADDNHPNVTGVYFDEIRISVAVFQNPILMGSAANAWEIAEEIHKAYKNWTPASLVNQVNPVRPGIEPIPDALLNVLSCNFMARGGFVGELSRVATPVIGNTSPVTITCATAGAAIFYTTDNSNPQPRNGTLYTVPFTAPTSGHKIKARAFLAGYLNSELGLRST